MPDIAPTIVKTRDRPDLDELFRPETIAVVGASDAPGDVTFRVPPFSRDEAFRMIHEVRAFELLAGHRGSPSANLDALVDVIMGVQRIALDGAVTELDINPLVALPDRAVALDELAREAC